MSTPTSLALLLEHFWLCARICGTLRQCEGSTGRRTTGITGC
jgi:hypothetical protein